MFVILVIIFNLQWSTPIPNIASVMTG